jgi:hypothetical protein
MGWTEAQRLTVPRPETYRSRCRGFGHQDSLLSNKGPARLQHQGRHAEEKFPASTVCGMAWLYSLKGVWYANVIVTGTNHSTTSSMTRPITAKHRCTLPCVNHKLFAQSLGGVFSSFEDSLCKVPAARGGALRSGCRWGHLKVMRLGMAEALQGV